MPQPSRPWKHLVLIVALLGTARAHAVEPVSINPFKRLWTRGIVHKLDPMALQDEAFSAHAAGALSDADLEKLIQGSSEDYFHEMDYGVTEPANQDALRTLLNEFIPGITREDAVRRTARGRDLWIVWTGGNDRLWSFLTEASLGGLDFLKTVSNHESLPATRTNRWEELGIVNEPCFVKSTEPQADRWGLVLDKRIVSKECPPYPYGDPFADPAKYPGIKVGARGQSLRYKGETKTLEVGSFFGLPTGVVGLRMFTNPDFDQKAADRWDPARFYTDPSYYNDPKLVRPYRVGMACAFCHVGPNPSRPPANFDEPKWANLNSNPGAQYFWTDRIFFWDYKKQNDNFIYQLVHTYRPGSLDTSLISSDQINDPRTMNAVYDLPARVRLAERMNSREQLSGRETLNAQFSLASPSVVPGDSHLRALFDTASQTVLSPRVLKDGSDSVGALGALNRVFVNIGLFSEEWVQNFVPVIGNVPLEPITPFRIDVAEKKSLYWKATVNQTPDLALFFLAASRPDRLADAPGGATYLKATTSPEVALGRKVFARNCARCHSSNLPDQAFAFFNQPDPKACMGANYPSCWKAYWDYTQTEEFKAEMEKRVEEPDFLKGNYLSTELRVPANVIDDQLCSPLATNALKGDIWDNFSSSSYKALPSIGEFTVNYPTTGGATTLTPEKVAVPGGGRGFIRPASLISLWSSAPFLQNNSLGRFDERGTVEGRLKSFDDSIQKLLNPELRGKDAGPGKVAVTYTTGFGDQLPGVMDVTLVESYLKIPRQYFPLRMISWLETKLAVRKAPKPGSQRTVAAAPPPASANVNANAKPGESWFSGIFSVFGGADDTDAQARTPAAAPSPAVPVPVDPEQAAENSEYLMVGPIPAGVPVNLLGNLDLSANPIELTKAVKALGSAVLKVRSGKLKGTAARDAFMSIAAQPLLRVAKCKDFVVNRGHYFGTRYSQEAKETGSPGLSAEEKSALIEYLKQM